MSKNNVIPFIKDKKVRDSVRADKEQGALYAEEARQRATVALNRINSKMDELRAMAQPELGSVRQPEPSSKQQVPPPPVAQQPSLDQTELEKEYRRKQDEMRKKREESNRSTIRSYNLLGKRGRDR